MGTIGAQEKTVFGKNVVIKIGTDTYALAKSLRATWRHAIYDEPVLSSAIPIKGTGHFTGEIDIEALYSVDNNFLTLTTPGANGQIPESTITCEETDIEGTPVKKTWTFKAMLNEVEHQDQEDRFVRANVRGPLTAVPTVA